MSKKRIAIIPARGGSKRVPQKNIKNFAGRPMITYILESLIESKQFDCIHVSTDSEKIKDIVQEFGVKIDFLRPNSLADDYTGILDVLRFVIEKYKEQGQVFDTIAMFTPCSPLLDSNDIDGIINSFESFDEFPLLSVTEFPVPVEWAFSQDSKGVLTPVFENQQDKRSQDLPVRFYDTGNFCILKEKDLFQSKDAVFNNYRGYSISKDKAVDIDTIEDFEFAEKLYQLRKN
jgi:N-acylneuraminate cytidylyltransferase